MIEIIRNQPIQALAAVKHHLSCPEYDFMQLVQKSDVQRVMVKRTPAQLTGNYSPISFTCAGGMVSSPGALTSTGAGDAYYTTGIQPNNTYRVAFRVSFTQFDPTGGYRVKLNNQWLALPDASGGAYSILSGSVEAYLDIPGSVTDYDLIIEVTGADNIVAISSINVASLSKIETTVLDETKAVIQTLAGSTITNYSNSPFSHITIDWSTITGTGIRYLRINDTVLLNTDMITNGTFEFDLIPWEDETGGSPTSDWTWDAGSGGRAYYDGTGSGGGISQSVVLPGGSVSEITFTVSGIGIGSGEGLQVIVKIEDTELPAVNYTITGPYTLAVDLSGYTGFVDVRVIFKPLNNTDTIYLDTVSLIRLYDSDNTSVPFNLQTKHSFTLLLYAVCDAPAFGFPFGNNFYLRMRTKGEINYLGYPDKTELYDFSNNESDILEANRQKTYRTLIHGSEEYVHDAISAMLLCDTLTIDGKEYVREGGYEMEPTAGIHKASARFDVRDKIGIAANYY